MLFDASLLFYHTGSTYNMTAGEAVTLAGVTGSGSASAVINLGDARDLGIGPGGELPTVELVIGTAITSSSATALVNLQFQGSTDSSHWTTYIETGANLTASYKAATGWNFPVPRRPPGAALPLYYRINVDVTNNVSASISTGTLLGGIILTPADSAGTMALYPAGFSVS